MAPVRGWWLVSYVVLWELVLVLGALVVALARQIGTLHLRLGPRGALEVDGEGPGLGEAPPPLPARDPDGRIVRVGGPGEDRLLLFVSPGCPICREVLPAIPAVTRAGTMRPLVLVDDDDPEAIAAFAGQGAPVLSVPAGAWAVPGTPYAVVLDALGVVRAKGTVIGLHQANQQNPA